MLALYIHFVGDLCRDVQRTVESRILKVSIYVTLNILYILFFLWCLFWIFVSVDTGPNWTMSVHWRHGRSSSAHTGTRNLFDIWTVHHQRQKSIKTNILLLFLPATCTKTVTYMCTFVRPFHSVESTIILFGHMLLFNWLLCPCTAQEDILQQQVSPGQCWGTSMEGSDNIFQIDLSAETI